MDVVAAIHCNNADHMFWLRLMVIHNKNVILDHLYLVEKKHHVGHLNRTIYILVIEMVSENFLTFKAA